jgi:hypothetical protein
MGVQIWVCRTIRKGSSDSFTNFDSFVARDQSFIFHIETLKNVKMKILKFILMLHISSKISLNLTDFQASGEASNPRERENPALRIIFAFLYPGPNQLHGYQISVIKFHF